MRDPKETAREIVRCVEPSPVLEGRLVPPIADRIAAAQREAWDAAIEAAAKVCEERADAKRPGGYSRGFNGERTAQEAETCATAIRAIPYPEQP